MALRLIRDHHFSERKQIKGRRENKLCTGQSPGEMCPGSTCSLRVEFKGHWSIIFDMCAENCKHGSNAAPWWPGTQSQLPVVDMDTCAADMSMQTPFPLKSHDPDRPQVFPWMGGHGLRWREVDSACRIPTQKVSRAFRSLLRAGRKPGGPFKVCDIPHLSVY